MPRKKINLLTLISAIDGVEGVRYEKQESRDKVNYTFRYRGIKFEAYFSGDFGFIDTGYWYKPKLLSNGKAKAAFVEWGTKLVPGPDGLKEFFLVTHVSNYHAFSFPFNDFVSETIETILKGYVEELPNILEQFSKDGQVEFNNDED